MISLSSKLIIETPASKTLEKDTKYVQGNNKDNAMILARTTWERRSDVFVVNFEHIHIFSNVSTSDFKQVNVSWEILNILNVVLDVFKTNKK